MDPPSITSPAKPPLITPSASPPPARPFHAPPHRMSDNGRPSERQRPFSTPRRTIRDASSSSTPQIQAPLDVVKERDASIHRLLDHWASLADRYSRRLDEDDIVDLQSGEVTRDNGILRNSRKCEFGALAAPLTEYITGDEGSEGDEGSDSQQDDDEDQYDPDELDAFADTYFDLDEGKGGRQCNVEAGGAVPPVTALDPADAADLHEFMDAEQKRKEMCGSDFDEEDIDDPLPEVFDDQTEEAGFSGLDEVERRSIEGGEEWVSEGEEDYAGGGNADEGANDFVLPPAIVDPSSEDELNIWVVDETKDPGPVSVSNKEDEPNNSDSDIEIIEPPIFFTPSKSQPAKKSLLPKSTPTRQSSRIPQKIPRQLHTPPQSYASSGPSPTPTRDQPVVESKTYPSNGPDIPSYPSSEYSCLETPTKVAVPRLNLALLSKTPRKLFKESPRSISAHASGSASESKPSVPTPKLKPIVLLTPRNSAKRILSTPRFIQSNETEEQSPTKSSKGKERALDIVQYKDHEVDRPSPTKTSKGKGRAQGIFVDSEPRTDPASIRYQASSSKHVAKGKAPHRAPSNEDSDDPILISPPSHRSSYPGPVEEEEEPVFSGASTSSRRTHESYSLPSSSPFAPGVKPSPLPKSQKIKPPESKKRKRTTSDLSTELPIGQSPEKKADRRDSPSRNTSSHASSSRFIDDGRSKSRSPKKRSSSRRRRRESHSESERESESSASERDDRRQRRRSRSRCKSHPAALHPYSGPYPPQNYPPIQDPRAQLIITHAMQQLSALVGAPWVPGHPFPGAVPHTPTHRHVSERPSNNQYVTPTHHHHPYPYSYDPNLSHATLPPNSPDNDSSPENSPPARRRTLVRRSRSRGRRVSFIVEEDNQTSDIVELPSNPLRLRVPVATSRSQEGTKTPKARTESVSPSDSDSDMELASASRFPRGRTPGPSIELPTRGNRDTSSKPRKHKQDTDI